MIHMQPPLLVSTPVSTLQDWQVCRRISQFAKDGPKMMMSPPVPFVVDTCVHVRHVSDCQSNSTTVPVSASACTKLYIFIFKAIEQLHSPRINST